MATFTTTGASVRVSATKQISGTSVNDFTNSVVYTVTAADGTTQNYTVVVSVVLSSAKAITAFSLAGVVGTINETTKTILLTMPYDTDLASLVAVFTTTGAGVNVGATEQISGTSVNDFTNSVVYTVTAADGTTQDYTVVVSVALSSAKAITAFSLAGVVGTINETTKTISLTMPFGTYVKDLVATFTTTGTSVKVDSIVQISGVTAHNFTDPIVYIVTAADGTTRDYIVVVTVALSPAKAITAFSLSGVVGMINQTAKTIAVSMPFGTDRTNLVATFTTTGTSVKVNSTVQISGVTAHNFTYPVTYTVTAADGTTQNYTVTVTETLNVKDVSVVIVSRANTLPDIIVGKITFETGADCTTSVEINGTHLDAGKGFVHKAYIYGTTESLTYTVHATTTEGINIQQTKVLTSDNSNIFSYQGNIDDYIKYLIPVVIHIYETYPTREDFIDVMLPGGVNYFSLFQKENIFSMKEATIRELYNSINIWHENNKANLKSAWPFFSDAELKAVSILNAVSYLWHYGNFNMISRAGCVQVNELITEDSADYIYADGKTPPIYWKTAVGMTDYLNSKIGCCTDHAFLTKALLEEAGFNSRRVYIGVAHVMTEVLIDSSWRTIDATAGLMVNTSMASMIEKTPRKTYLFFTPYMYFDSPLFFSLPLYPSFPSYIIGTGFEEGGGATDISQINIFLGYYTTETDQLNGL
ncbi:MAG: hypothetical protein CVU51_00765 [Deltaproteobacteria bacterium HGW-Deltaproteobacteria-1]|nr:MAG: hypothetical protein CVU51_00765 [Deltaproteobacteria bacterium HGW-Deltaproteobacteria-1]